MFIIKSSNADDFKIVGVLSCDPNPEAYFAHLHGLIIFPLRSSIYKASCKGVGRFCSVLDFECFRTRCETGYETNVIKNPIMTCANVLEYDANKTNFVELIVV